MSSGSDLLIDGFARVRGTVHAVLDNLDDRQLTARVGAEANPIGWLVWHLARVQDDHVAGLAGTEQRWTVGGWARRFGLPFDDAAIGYGQTDDEVAQVQGVAAADLGGYLDDVYAATVDYLRTLGDADFDRVVDTSWDPPVTVGIRLVSVLNDDTQHAGQAAYVRGLLERSH